MRLLRIEYCTKGESISPKELRWIINGIHRIYITIGIFLSVTIVYITLFSKLPLEYIIPVILIIINIILLIILLSRLYDKLQPLPPPKDPRNPIDKYLTYADVEFAIYNLKKQIVKENFLEYEYLFSWENVPGIDSRKLINFFQKIQFLEWVQNPTIEKSPDGKEIKIFEGNNSCSLKLNEEQTNAVLKIADSKNYEFLVKNENKKLKIHRYDPKKNIIIGVDRGGAIVGGMLAKNLGLAITTLAISYANPPKSNLKNIDFSSIKKILLVDDAIRKGKHMDDAMKILRRDWKGIVDEAVRKACILQYPNATIKSYYHVYKTKNVDIYLPWDKMHLEEDMDKDKKKQFEELCPH